MYLNIHVHYYYCCALISMCQFYCPTTTTTTTTSTTAVSIDVCSKTKRCLCTRRVVAKDWACRSSGRRGGCIPRGWCRRSRRTGQCNGGGSSRTSRTIDRSICQECEKCCCECDGRYPVSLLHANACRLHFSGSNGTYFSLCCVSIYPRNGQQYSIIYTIRNTSSPWT